MSLFVGIRRRMGQEVFEEFNQSIQTELSQVKRGGKNREASRGCHCRYASEDSLSSIKVHSAARFHAKNQRWSSDSYT